MRLILVFIILISLHCNAVFSFSSTPGEAPESQIKAAQLKELWDIPIDSIVAQTIRSYSRGSIKVEEVYYQSREY